MKKVVVAALASLVMLGVGACSVFHTRPTQEMSDTGAAIRAAREVQADTLAPELYRQSNEWFFRAKREYKFKNFQMAKEYADKSRYFAEQAEFESLRNGGTRTAEHVSDPMATQSGGDAPPPPGPGGNPNQPPTTEYEYPAPTGTPVESYEKMQQAPPPTAPTAPPNTPPPPP